MPVPSGSSRWPGAATTSSSSRRTAGASPTRTAPDRAPLPARVFRRRRRRALSLGGDEGRVHLDYFNADGGLASFCANGTRCAARYAVTRRLVADGTPVLETGWALIPARVDGELVSLDLPPLPMPDDPLPIFGDGLPATGIPMHVGVPHLVVFVDGDLSSPGRREPRTAAAKPLGPSRGSQRELRASPARDRSRCGRTSGASKAETLACGSGVVASAVTAARLGLVAPRSPARRRSGVAFTVALTDNETGLVEASLTGDAREIFEAELNEEAWQE